jgi:phosphohistidine phosphatase SixA
VKVFLVRHADAGDVETPPGQPDPDPPLLPSGKSAIETLASHMRESGDVPTVVYASPLRRTRQTAKILADELGLPAVRIEDGLAPTRHKGPAFSAVMKKLTSDESLKRICVVSHHDSIREGLTALNFADKDDVDPIAKGELRILDIDRKTGKWKERGRCLPSDLGLDDLY